MPKFLLERSTTEGINSSPIGKISNTRPSSFADPKDIDQEEDGTFISAYSSIRRFVNEYMLKSNETDSEIDNDAFRRTLYRKSGTKLPRYCAAFQLLSKAMKYCSELTKYIRFDHGLHIDANENYSGLKEFVKIAEDHMSKKFQLKMKKGSFDGQVILPIKKPAVLSAKFFYDFTLKTAIKLFDSTDVDKIAKQRIDRKYLFTNSSSNNVQPKKPNDFPEL